MIELKVPQLGESIQEVMIGRWLKQEGDAVAQDEVVVELETDKASTELRAPVRGVLTKIIKAEGAEVAIGDVVATFQEESAAAPPEESGQPARTEADGRHRAEPSREDAAERAGKPSGPQPAASQGEREPTTKPATVAVTPSARRALLEHGVTAEEVASGDKPLRREDVVRYVRERTAAQDQAAPAKTPPQPSRPVSREEAAPAGVQRPPTPSGEPGEPSDELEELVPMSLIRRRIASRLVEAQKQAALLTTFNEIDMSDVIGLRQRYRESFQAKYGVKLGFMSFFVKAVVDALKQIPEVNAEIRAENMIAYRNYYHIGIAIGGGRGLVVPVLRHADRLSFAEIEQAISDFAKRAADNKLEPHELEGGTFTISNGGIYGSLLSTPIVNPPQSGVLGMHAIQERPVAHQGQVVIRPMMYVALTYDHRLVDGREAVTFLRRIKEAVEAPARLLIEV